MPSYAAFLGHQPHISVAELAVTVPGFNLTRVEEPYVAFFDSPVELDQEFLGTLGGIILLARRITSDAVTLEDIPKLLMNELADAKRGKLTFSLRTVNVPKRSVQNLYRTSKDWLRRQGRASRYVGSEKKPAPPVLLHDAGLLDGKHGCELTIISLGEDLWVGRTVAAQDINAYTKRDMEKPVRDTTVGLLPPKLAQVMVNCGAWLASGEPVIPDPTKRAKKPEPLTVFDPFCGTGVIPLECLYRGWHVIASDVSLKAVNGTEKNIEWIRKEFKILKKDVDAVVFKHDATKPFDLKKKPNIIVTETTLGPAFENRPPIKEAAKLKTENEKIQAAFIESCSTTLPGVPLCVTWPVWKIRDEFVFLEKIWDVIHKAGYRAILPSGVEPSVPGRVSLLYRRPDQFVGREIVMLKPVKK